MARRLLPAVHSQMPSPDAYWEPDILFFDSTKRARGGSTTRKRPICIYHNEKERNKGHRERPLAANMSEQDRRDQYRQELERLNEVYFLFPCFPSRFSSFTAPSVRNPDKPAYRYSPTFLSSVDAIIKNKMGFRVLRLEEIAPVVPKGRVLVPTAKISLWMMLSFRSTYIPRVASIFFLFL